MTFRIDRHPSDPTICNAETSPRRTPAQVFRVGSFVLTEMHERDWRVRDLARAMGTTDIDAVIAVILGERDLTSEDAEMLAGAFGTSPDLWRNLDRTYRREASAGDEAAGRERG